MDFYTFPMSMACRAVQLTAKALGVELNRIHLDLMKGEQLGEDFVAINPQHCVPTLVDEDLTLWESRAICQYLVNQHAEDDTLYPKEPKLRAKLDFFIHFDMGTLSARFGRYVFPVLMQSESPCESRLEKVQEALGWLNGYLADSEYAGGSDSPTIADHILVATVSTIQECGIDLGDYENVTAWLERCTENLEGYEEENGEGAKMFGEAYKSKLEAMQ